MSEILSEFDPIFPNPSEVLEAFRKKELSDKSFSKLYSRKLGLSSFPGIIIHIVDGYTSWVYWIDYVISQKQESKKWIVNYDFRKHFNNLHSWLLKRNLRPSGIICEESCLKGQIRKSISAGSLYSPNFFLIVQQWPGSFLHIRSYEGANGLVYIECSEERLDHYSGSTKLDIVSEKGMVLFNTGLPYSLVKMIYKKTKKITAVMGLGTVIELPLVRDKLYLLSAQRSVNKAQDIPYLPEVSSSTEIRVISKGKAEGILTPVDTSNLEEAHIKRHEKGIIIGAESTSSDLSIFIERANGFLFERGSMLSHLSILLREHQVPAMIKSDLFELFSPGDHLYFDTDVGEVYKKGTG